MNSSRKVIRDLVRKTTLSLFEKRQNEYGSQGYLNELDGLIDELKTLKVSLRKGPNRLKYRKEMHRLQDAIGAIRYLKRVATREGIKTGLLNEGGLKAPELTGDVILDPQTVSAAIDSYSSVINMWNEHLSQRGLDPVTLVGPVGSTSYHSIDSPDTSYGDVDYLVSFPADIDQNESQDEIRRKENEVKRIYEGELRTFLNQSHDIESYVNAEATNRGSPFLIIVKLPDGRHVQVDTIVTFPRYTQADDLDKSQWMPGRWTPERGLKGYTIGHLYMALGKYFNMSIGDRGVTTKIRDGERVSSRMRKGASLETISTNIRTFIRDIAAYLGVPENLQNEMLLQNPGVNPENVAIEDLARGIKGLAITLEENQIIDSHNEMLRDILSVYESGIKENAENKLSKGLSQKKYEDLLLLNSKVSDIVRSTFEIGVS